MPSKPTNIENLSLKVSWIFIQFTLVFLENVPLMTFFNFYKFCPGKKGHFRGKLYAIDAFGFPEATGVLRLQKYSKISDMPIFQSN